MITDVEEKILIVDDNTDVLESVSSLISSRGFSVVSCENAKDALDKLHENRIVAILTDISMPVLSGLELLEKVHNINPEIPVILMTGYAELDIAIDAIQRGAFDFVTKPFNTPHLMRAIEKAIQYYKITETQNNYQITLEDTVILKTRELADALSAVKDMNVEIIWRLSVLLNSGILIQVTIFFDGILCAKLPRLWIYIMILLKQ
jgi:putative two-component system response regulator